MSGVTRATDIHTLSGAYALDALTEIERAAFARHVAQCEVCAIEVAELRETASRLGAAGTQTPPLRLRDAVLAEVSRTRQISAGPAEPTGPANVRRWRLWTAAAVAAGIVAVGGGASVGLVQEGRLNDAREQVAALRAERLRISAVLAAPDLRVRTQAMPGGGRVSVAIAPSLDQAVVTLDELPAPSAQMAYQLWLIRGNSPASAGVLAPGQGSDVALVDSLGSADTLGVTLEPAGGSPAPTTPVLAGVPLL